MPNYLITNHSLEFINDFADLKVTNLTTGTSTTHNLGTGLKVESDGEYYEISSAWCSTCTSRQFDPDENDTVNFTGAKMIGVTVVRIECKVHEYTFHLEDCPVYLKIESDKLVVNSPEDETCISCPACVTEVVTDLAPCS